MGGAGRERCGADADAGGDTGDRAATAGTNVQVVRIGA